MNSDYNKVWEVMNDLEMTAIKICSAREIIDTAVEAIQRHEYDKAETLATAAYEFLGYYLGEFDEKFKLAWKETIVKQKEEETNAWDAVNKEKEYYEPSMPPWGHSDLEYLSQNKEPVSCDKDDSSPKCRSAWNSFWEENYYPEDHSKYYYDYDRNDLNRSNPFTDKVVKWMLPIEQNPEDLDYYVSFPDDLLEAAELKEGDQVEWVDRGDGSYLLRKVTKSLEMDEC